MLTKFRAKNFKAWKDTGEIRMAPLTVLFGSNSAGKTSIPQLLLLLKQTADSPDRRRALHFGDSRTLVDAGTFDDAVHNHDLGQSLEIEMAWSLDKPLDVVDSKWWGWRNALANAGVPVYFLCEREIAAKYAQKMGG